MTSRPAVTRAALRAVETLLFEVLASELRDDDNNFLAECPPYELVQTVQAEVDKIVAAAKARNVN